MLDTNLGFCDPFLATTLAGGQNTLSWPVAPVYEVCQLKFVKASLRLQCIGQSALVAEVRMQESADAVNWPASTDGTIAFATPVTQSTEGTNTPDAFQDISGLLTKRYMRFVVSLKNGTGITTLNTVLVSIRIERRVC